MSKVKICGLSRPEDVFAVNSAMPDYVGFVFAPSRRRVDAGTAAALKKSLDPRIKTVGVFVNETCDAVVDIYRRGIIDLAQLHGDEDGAYIKRLKAWSDCPVIKSVSIGDTMPQLPGFTRMYSPYERLLTLEAESGDSSSLEWSIPLSGISSRSPPNAPDFYIFDTLSSLRGGIGQTFNWELLRDYDGQPYFLAGGLTLGNVTDALSIISPYCVDVSSGVETDGVKDSDKIHRFIETVRTYGE